MSEKVQQEPKRSGVPMGLLFAGLALLAAAVPGRTVSTALAGRIPGGGEAGASMINVATEPPGAAVYIDDRYAGAAPVTLMSGPGRHTVELKREGYESVMEVVDIRPGATGNLNVMLEPVNTAKVKVSSNPGGATVYMDGTLAGHTPCEPVVTPGERLIEVEKPGHEAARKWITVEKGEYAEVEFELVDKVLEYLQAAARQDPKDLFNLMDLAHYYFINDQMEKAADTFGKAVEVSYAPDAPKEAAKRLEKEIRKHSRWPGKELGEFKEKIEEWREAAHKKYPKSYRVLQEKSREFERKRDYGKAMEVWREGTEAHPDNPMIWNEYARLAIRARKVSLAKDAIMSAVEAAEGDFNALHQAVQMVHRNHRMFPLKEHRDMVLEATLEKMLKPMLEHHDIEDGERVQVLHDMALTYLHMEKNDKAVEFLEKAIAQQEHKHLRFQWLQQLSGIYEKEQNWTEARKMLRKAEEEAQNNQERAIIERKLRGLDRLD